MIYGFPLCPAFTFLKTKYKIRTLTHSLPFEANIPSKYCPVNQEKDKCDTSWICRVGRLVINRQKYGDTNGK